MEYIIGILISAIFGAIFGSYSTLFAYRLPKQESCFGRYFGPKSRCPKCEKVLRTRELIPLINWLVTFGKCSKCGIKIPRSHLFIESFCTILFVLCYSKFGFSENFIIHALLSCISLILIVTSFKNRIFPDQALIFLSIIAVAYRVLQDQSIINLIFSLSYGVVACAIFHYIFNKISDSIIAKEQHSYDFMKFILIASTFFQPLDFLLYYLIVIISFCVIIIFDAVKKRKSFGYGFCVVLPFLWLTLI